MCRRQLIHGVFCISTRLHNHKYLNQNIFITPKRKSIAISNYYSPFRESLATTTLFRALWLCLFWYFIQTKIILYVALCFWLLLVSMFSRFIWIVACIRAFVSFALACWFSGWSIVLYPKVRVWYPFGWELFLFMPE